MSNNTMNGNINNINTVARLTAPCTCKRIFTSAANREARNTSAIKCIGCGETISETRVNRYGEVERTHVYKVTGLSGYAEDGKAVYFDEKCAEPVGYHNPHRRENVCGHINSAWFRLGDFSIEVETVSKHYSDWLEAIERDPAFCNVYFSMLMLGYRKNKHSQQCEEDCTNLGEHHAYGKSAESFSRWIHARTKKEMACMRDRRCGAHIHVTCKHHFSDDIWFEIWNPVFQCMKFKDADGEPNEEKMIEFWGRTFTTYAQCNKGYHGDAINWHTGHDTVEFRLAHIDNADQIVRCLKFWRACVNVVNKWGYTVHDTASAKKLGAKIVKQCFIPLITGKKFYKGY